MAKTIRIIVNSNYHIPVLASRCIEALNIKPNGVYVDVTFGGGGHSRLILEQLGADGTLMVFDQDNDALKNIIDDKRVIPVKANFKFLKNFLRYYDLTPVDGILADLGISSHHIDAAERGFTFRNEDAPLDMRMNPEGGKSALDIINEYDRDALKQVFKFYGELSNASKIANSIVSARIKEKIATSGQLNAILEPITPKIKGERSKFLAQVYQALRIEVNRELEALKILLHSSAEVLKKEGRLVVISYHSLEDRIVKNFIKTGNTEGVEKKDIYGHSSSPLRAVHSKVVVPDDEEISENPRSRSAKLRIAEKI